MAEKFKTTRYLWKHKGGIAIGTIPALLVGLAVGYNAAENPNRGTVFSCTINKPETEADCPNGTLEIRRKTLSLKMEIARRSTHTGDATLVTPTDIFTAVGTGRLMKVFDSRLPTPQNSSHQK